MEIILKQQPRKYLASVDTPTREKLYSALDDVSQMQGDIKKLKGSRLYRYKIARIPEVRPDAMDRAMMRAAKRNNASGISLSAFREEMDGCSGRVLLKLPKALHQRLRRESLTKGVSLNQYMLHKLSR